MYCTHILQHSVHLFIANTMTFFNVHLYNYTNSKHRNRAEPRVGLRTKNREKYHRACIVGFSQSG